MVEDRHILIIDDNEEDRMVLRRVLRQAQEYRYTFTEVGLGEKALAVCQRLVPNCILLDYHLPDMSGIEVLQELRHSETELRFVPVIILTGQGSEDIAVQAIKGGAQDYIKKLDYTFERINTSIDNAIEHMRLKSALHAIEKQREELFHLERLARTQAEDANQTKIRFMGMISHEMGGPLASMKMLADSALSEKATFDKARQILRIIGNEADRLYDLVSQLLDLSRMQSASLTLQPEIKDLREILSAMQLPLTTLTPKHQLVMRVAEDLPLLLVDPRRVTQVIFNLVGNAVKFSPPRTTITLTAFAIEGGAQIEVMDEGIGIPEDKRTFVFEPFQQLEGTNQAKGTGLGLAICKGIVEAHGGEMWITDGGENGTIFCFTLPSAERSREQSNGAASIDL